MTFGRRRADGAAEVARSWGHTSTRQAPRPRGLRRDAPRSRLSTSYASERDQAVAWRMGVRPDGADSGTAYLPSATTGMVLAPIVPTGGRGMKRWRMPVAGR